jgi:GNAT superfamily N-acetyltransferase
MFEPVKGRQFGDYIERAKEHTPEDVKPFNDKISLAVEPVFHNAVVAYHHGSGRRVGHLAWFPGKPDRDEQGAIKDNGNIGGGIISGVHVGRQFQRKGLATAMLGFARERFPEHEIRHSNALTPDGKAWAERTP